MEAVATFAELRRDIVRLADAIHAFRFGPEGRASREGALFLAYVLQAHSPEPPAVVMDLEVSRGG